MCCWIPIAEEENTGSLASQRSLPTIEILPRVAFEMDIGNTRVMYLSSPYLVTVIKYLPHGWDSPTFSRNQWLCKSSNVKSHLVPVFFPEISLQCQVQSIRMTISPQVTVDI